MHQPIPLTRDVVLIGGGHTHALVLRRWGMKPLPGARLTLISPEPFAAYSGMLPGHIAGHYDRSALDIDLVRLARFSGARLILGQACALDPESRSIEVAGRGSVRFDIASLDIGVSSGLPDLPGFSEYGIPAKPLGPFAARWDRFARSAGSARRADVVLIGAGVAGVELALAMAFRLRALEIDEARVTLLEAGTALSGLPHRARRALLERLRRAGIALMENTVAASVSEDAVTLGDGQTIPCGFCTGVAGARPQAWLEATGLHLSNGFVTVDADLRASGNPSVYAVGDCAHMARSPRPKAGVFAVRQAPVLFDNIRADLTGRPRRSFRPQSAYLKLVSVGEKSALAEKAGGVTTAGWLWRVKDRIDRRFMAKFGNLPAMPAPALPRDVATGVREALAGAKPLCGGCGAKVGPGDLRAALAGLGPHRRSDVLDAPGDDAAIIALGEHRQVLSTDHLRAVVEDPALMARIAAVHALGDVWAMGARPQAALASVILPRMSAAMQRATLAEITQSAAAVFDDAGAELAGGHTTLGAELTIGFTVTGLVSRAPLTLAGAVPGDVLVLTKPLGSGVLLAAEMMLEARGDWIADLWEEMTRSSGPASEVLAQHAHAATDVTGFGLAGHLLGMADASGVACTLDPAAVPLYAGARDLAETGTRSTLFPANKAFAEPRMTGFQDAPETDLLFDPQTCGGLLAAVPAEHADTVLAALSLTPTPGVVVGSVTDGPPGLNRL